MQTRRDQANAHRFVARRLSSSLLSGDPDAADAPMRRASSAVIGSVMVAVLGIAVAGIWGLLRPAGSTGWQSGQSLIAEKETGTRYAYVGGVLHPVLNYASARLLLKDGAANVVTVSRAALASVPHGLPVGIPGAPDELPLPAELTTGPLESCAVPASRTDGGSRPGTQVFIGMSPAGLVTPGDDTGILVVGPDGSNYLIWSSERFRLGGTARGALGYDGVTAVAVSAAWLDTVPAGPDLVAPAIVDRGAAGPAVAGAPARVGQIFQVGNVGVASQYYLVQPSGLSTITQTVAALLLGDPATRAAYPGRTAEALSLTAADAAAAPHAPPTSVPGLPAQAPKPAASMPGGVALCAERTSANPDAVSIGERSVAPLVVAGPPPVDAATGAALADEVTVAPGRGALMQASPGPGIRSGTVYLITDVGDKFPVADDTALTDLGYQKSDVSLAPGAVLALLPTGPRLDATSAGLISSVSGLPQPSPSAG